MAIITKPLTDKEIKTARPGENGKKLFDGDGLVLVISKRGTKSWRVEFRLNGKKLTKTLGKYPDISLAKARLLRNDIVAKAREGIDPRESKQKDTLENVSKDWLKMMQPTWSESTIKKMDILFSKNLYPYSGKINIRKVRVEHILDDIQRVLDRGKDETADRLLMHLNRVYKYAVTKRRCDHNIIADIDKKAIIPPIKEKNFPAITKKDDLKKLLIDINGYRNNFATAITTAIALEIAPFLALRPVNLRSLEKNEVNFEQMYIHIDKEKMKTKVDFIMPFGEYVAEKLREAISMDYRDSPYMFPGPNDKMKPISDATLGHALKRMGYKDIHTMHGFRSTFSTNMHNMISTHGYSSEIIEACLAHVDSNKVRAAYNRSDEYKYLEEKRELMQFYTDWLLCLFD
jgi:integrase